MKIGVMTYHRALNYGAVLQAFSLVRVLRDMGHECEVIDYRSEVIERENRFPTLKEMISHPRSAAVKVYSYGKHRKKAQNLSRFLDENRIVSLESATNETELTNITSKYDAIICGSDQVWNMALNGMDRSYTLSFAKDNQKKIAYAASFGDSNITDDQLDIIYKDISRFSNISIREATGITILNKLGIVNSTMVPDPVLLIKQDEWLSFAQNEKRYPYILIYELSSDKRILEKVFQFAKDQNLDVIRISNSTFHYKNEILMPAPDIRTFLSCFKNATAIATTSFHGALLAAIMNKNVTVYKKGDNRIENLYSQLGISQQIMKPGAKFKNADCKWEDVNKQIAEMREKGIQFLKTALNKSK